MELLEIFERLIGHLAWPVAAYLIFRLFHTEIRSIIQRIKKAKYAGVEIDLERQLEEVASDAENVGITIGYPLEAFPQESIDSLEDAPELVFIRSWQEIENVITDYYKRVSGLSEKRFRFISSLTYLIERGVIDDDMGMLIRKLRDIRNSIVHSTDPNITRGEALVWLGIAKSVKDRLTQKLAP
jgi:hypothetical protein